MKLVEERKDGKVIIKNIETGQRIEFSESEYNHFRDNLRKQKLSVKTALELMTGSKPSITKSSLQRYARGLDRVARLTSIEDISIHHKLRMKLAAERIYRRKFLVSGEIIIVCARGGEYSFPFMFSTVIYPSRRVVIEYVEKIVSRFNPASHCQIVNVDYRVERVE